MKKNVFVFGLNQKNRELMEETFRGEEIVFHSLLETNEIVEAESYDFEHLLVKARKQLDTFDGTIDGITTFWDFPATGLHAILTTEYGLPGPTPESVVRCSHKYQSRLIQERVIPEHIPEFVAFDPFAEDPLPDIGLSFPFFIKPVNSYASVLSFYIGSETDFEEALPQIRDGVGRYVEPYNVFLELTGQSDKVQSNLSCIAEKVIGGQMCTVEGYARDGEVSFINLIDSHCYPGRTTFTRYQYPSDLEDRVRERIYETSGKIVGEIGFENAAFNIEYFYDKRLDKLWLLEINTRVSQSHSDLFRKVDGASNHKVIVDLALGRKPVMPEKEGKYKVAAKFYLREFWDGLVTRVPDKKDIERLIEKYPDSIILPHVEPEQRLSELLDQESYSYRLGVVYMGGMSEKELLEKFAWCSSELDFRVRTYGPDTGDDGYGTSAEKDSDLSILEELPYEIKRIEHTWVTMRDGCRLSAKVWYPYFADLHPVSAVLEYIPYRKRDHTRVTDAMQFNYLAGHGLAGVRVDMRGSGDSEGILQDEYLALEQQDGLDILKWIADQPWCNGNVGMIGISWGGFNSLQIAALNPPELKAIITVCSTDDRYRNDVHYMGGCLLGDNLSWASTMFARNTQPPDPEIVGEKWKEMWLDRLQGSGLWLKPWVEHQKKDGYWKHGSVCEDYSRIEVPVLAVSGWADGYSNSVFRMLEHFNVPRKGIIGPWSHMYPHFGKPGPAIGFLQESLRWWNHWLNGMYSGIVSEPMLSVWMQKFSIPDPKRDYHPGRWVGLADWPADVTENKVYYLNPEHKLGHEPSDRKEDVVIQSPLSVGLNGGKWCSYSAAPDLPHDQREEEGGALVFDTPALEEDINIIGAPVLELEISSSHPVALIAVRLSEVSKDFHATRITYGVLNLTHRESHEQPTELKPGQKYKIGLALNEIAHVLKKGHWLRLSISSSYWPVIWPAPERARLTISTGAGRLILPGIKNLEKDTMERTFDEPLAAPGTPVTQVYPGHDNWIVTKNMLSDTTTVEVIKDGGKKKLEDIGMEITIKTLEHFSFEYDNYDSVKGETCWEMQFEREGWSVHTYTNTVLTSDKDYFYINATLDAYHDGVRLYAGSWNERIQRELV